MDRRDFVKAALAAMAVGAVAPETLAEPVSYTTPWIDIAMPGVEFVYELHKDYLEFVRWVPLTISEAAMLHRELFLDNEVSLGEDGSR